MSDVTANADIPAGDGERRHDPLCPAPLCDWTGESGNDCMGYEDCHHLCQCDLIARVREDERDKRRADLIWQDGYDIALRDAVDAVKFRVHDLTNCMKNDDCHILARGADLALSDIQALPGGSHE